ISPIVAASLCMKPKRMLTEAQAAKVMALKQSSPSFNAMRRLTMRFRGIMRSGDLDKLDQWLHEAAGCGLQAIQRFARTVGHDLAAVRNALTERWSNGPVEGQITGTASCAGTTARLPMASSRESTVWSRPPRPRHEAIARSETSKPSSTSSPGNSTCSCPHSRVATHPKQRGTENSLDRSERIGKIHGPAARLRLQFEGCCTTSG